MSGKTINIKDKSLSAYLLEHHLESQRYSPSEYQNNRPYHLMQDEMILKNTSGLNVEDTVIFEIEDVSQGSRSKLLNTYIYGVGKYDDFSVKLKLTDFIINRFNLAEV